MKVAVLTSSRADFGIYLPLLKAMKGDAFFDVRLVVFGTHLSSFHGHTIDVVEAEGIPIDYRIETVLASDAAASVSTSMALTSMKFSAVWEKENYDLVFCLGDRYEMFAAVSAGVPFGFSFAHIHGGETTLGAIDNKFRHCLSLFSTLHFTATEEFANRVSQITNTEKNIFPVGALSLENLENITLLNINQFQKKFGIDSTGPSILVTFHPETVGIENNEQNTQNVVTALSALKGYQIIITMPNADTSGNRMRRLYTEFASKNSNIVIIENFGTQGYFSCMKHSKLVVGNSSSGIIEAASFGKYVVDIGNRQKGRVTSPNVIHCEANADAIEAACREALAKGAYNGQNIYYKGGASKKIIDVLKEWKP
jgi:GDP/UDP-N,N'-diacetylbacillosamine 2-epimerase (hydrolysing)